MKTSMIVIGTILASIARSSEVQAVIFDPEDAPYNAAADCTTDDFPAFNAVLAARADADVIERTLLNRSGANFPPPPVNPMPADRIKWEHIQRIYEQCGRNVSETARRLQMHRRTLQRILAKYAPKETEGDSPLP